MFSAGKQRKIIIHPDFLRLKDKFPAVPRKISGREHSLPAVAVPVNFLSGSTACPRGTNPETHGKTADRKPSLIPRLQIPDQRLPFLRKQKRLRKCHCQTAFQIHGQEKHDRHQKQLRQKQYHQRRASIHSRNVIYPEEKKSKNNFLHRLSPIGGTSAACRIS